MAATAIHQDIVVPNTEMRICASPARSTRRLRSRAFGASGQRERLSSPAALDRRHEIRNPLMITRTAFDHTTGNARGNRPPPISIMK
jgi:hypothetical protein